MLTLDHPLKEILAKRILSGLKRHGITTCSKWAESYRVMGQPFPGLWKFDHHPWVRELHDCTAPITVGRKAAQMAFTETALNRIFFAMDVKGLSCMYVLPASKPDASDFSTSRFDPALELSPHLENMFSEVKNVGHKRAGSANLFIRGSRSRSQLKSVPASEMVFDEVDEMVQENIPLAFERMSGQEEKHAFLLSTPTIEKYGIDSYYETSTQEHYFFKCPHCGRFTELVFPDCLVTTAEKVTDDSIKESYLICHECKHPLNHLTKRDWLKDKVAGGSGAWIKTYSDREVRGFSVSQFYSMTVSPPELAIAKIKGDNDKAYEQEWYNSKGGIPHTVKDAKLSLKDIDACMGAHLKTEFSPPGAMVTMGIDVGKWLHYEIDQWFVDRSLMGPDINLITESRVLSEGKVLHFEELDQLMQKFNVSFCVIDANPERRKAFEFAQRFYGRVRMCFYGNSINGKTIVVHSEDEHTITVDRTTWLDLSLGRVRRKKIVFPTDTSLDYKNHLCSLVRVYQIDKNGNPTGTYVKGNDDDHFAHARNYAEIALPLCASLMTSQDIRDVL